MRMDHLMMDLTPAAFRYSQADAITPPNAYYGPTGADIVSATGTPVIDNLYAYPFYAGLGGTIDRIAFNVTVTGGVGSKARCGLYDSDTSGYGLVPRNLLVDGGEFDGTLVQTDIATVTPNVVMNEGQMYWLAFLCGTGAPTLTTFTSGWHMFGRNSSFNAQFGWQKVGFGYQALPALFPTAGLTPITGNGTGVLVAVRYATYNRMKRA